MNVSISDMAPFFLTIAGLIVGWLCGCDYIIRKRWGPIRKKLYKRASEEEAENPSMTRDHGGVLIVDLILGQSRGLHITSITPGHLPIRYEYPWALNPDQLLHRIESQCLGTGRTVVFAPMYVKNQHPDFLNKLKLELNERGIVHEALFRRGAS